MDWDLNGFRGKDKKRYLQKKKFPLENKVII